MASEAVPTPTNGFGHHAAASSPQPQSSVQQAPKQDVPKEEVAWYFVERYYNTMSRNPDKLPLFFNKRSQFVAGVEDEKVSVCIGQKTISERIKELNFQNCKVRVTNVDSQTSGDDIVIQVIGQMSNNDEPHRKFVQTFVLATQANGYFVLNDIFRFLADEEDEDEPEGEVTSTSVAEPTEEVKGAEAAGPAELVPEPVAAAAEEKEQEPGKAEPTPKTEPAETNGAPGTAPSEASSAAIATPAAEPKVEGPEKPKEDVVSEQPEKPREPAPTPVPAAENKAPPKPVTIASGPPKAATPMTWAQRVTGKSASSATAPAASAQPKPPTQPKPAAPAQQAVAAAVSKPSAPSPARQPSPPNDSGNEGSSGGWQTAGADHNRKQSRAHPQPNIGDGGKVRAYVRNVYSATKDQLESVLSKFGQLAYCDINRQKNSAFVEFATVEGFNAAVAANPHTVGSDNIYVEERRQTNQFNSRGGFRGGRVGYDGRGGQGRGNFSGKGDGGPRGTGFPTGRGGRGTATGASRGGRGTAA